MTVNFTANVRRFEPSEGPLRVVCQGQMDIHCKEQFHGAVEEALRRRPPFGLEIDLSTVDFIDSIGLQVLMQALLRIDGEDVGWNVVTSPTVQNLLDIVGMARRSSESGGGWLATGGYGDTY
jgi:anti-anti-sigma factor